MALTGERAQALLSAVLERVRPQLPAGVRIEMLPHRKWTTLAQGSADGGYATTIRGVGAPSFFPLRTRAKLTVQDAVSIVLNVAFQPPDPADRGKEQDFDVRAVVAGDEVLVSYRLPGAHELTARIELTPIPLNLL